MRGDICSQLAEKDVKAEDIVKQVIEHPENVVELFSGVSSAKPRVRFGSAKILTMISEKNPELFYPEMDFFVRLLDSDNAILKWTALDIVASLTVVDSNNKFDVILFRKFLGFLEEGSLITAAHVVDNIGKIAQAKPEFREKFTEALLNVEDVSLPTEECRDILIGKTIDAFSSYYGQIKDKAKVNSFVRRHLNNQRRATKAKAEKFLKKYEKR